MTTERLFLDLIKQKHKNLTKSEKLVVDYILKNKENASYLSARKISENIGVGESTVVRLAHSLGYANFSQMKSSMQEEFINHQLNKRMQQANQTIDKNNVAYHSVNMDISNIQQTLDNIDTRDFEAVVDLLGKATYIYSLGYRSSIADAHYLGVSLKKMLGNTFPITSNGVMLDHCLQTADENCVVVTFSFPRYTKQTIEIADYLKKNNKINLVSITDSIKSPLVEISDFVFLTSSDSFGPLYSHVSSITLINALVAAVGQKYPERVETNLDKEEEDVANRNIFYL